MSEKKCRGCGIVLQDENVLLDGYTTNLENDLCQRCFKMKHFIRSNWEVCPIRGVFFQTFWYNCSKKERNDSYLRKKISRKKRRALW